MSDSSRSARDPARRTQKSNQGYTPSSPDAPHPLTAPQASQLLLVQRAHEDPQSLTTQNVMSLQRTIGNRATASLLQPILSSPETAMDSGPEKASLTQESVGQRATWIQREEIEKELGGTEEKKTIVKWKKAEVKEGKERSKRERFGFGFKKKPIEEKGETSGKDDKDEKSEKEEPKRVVWKKGDSQNGNVPKKSEGIRLGVKKNKRLIEETETEEEKEIEFVMEEDEKQSYDPSSFLGRFQSGYDTLMKKKYPHLHTDMTKRLNEFMVLCEGFEIEEYGDEILANPNVNKLLTQMNELAGKGPKKAQQQSADLVADLLLSASLIPTQVTQSKDIKFHKAPVYKRLSANVISLTRLIDVLFDVNQQLAESKEIGKGEALNHIDLDSNQPLAKRMLNLTLVNLQETAREKLGDNPLFKAMLDNKEIFKTMMASGGAVEQQFLNSCVTTAVTQELQENVSNLAALLLVGRGVADFIQDQINNKELEEEVSEWHKFGVSLKKAAQKRVTGARGEFDTIELLALSIMQKSPVAVDKLQALIRRWSRVMQKLSAMTDLSEGKSNVPVLTKRLVHNHWNVSAGLSAASLYVLARPNRRTKGMTGNSYRESLSQTTKRATVDNTTEENLNTWLGKKKRNACRSWEPCGRM